MKVIAILFALLCAACIAGEIIAALAEHDDDREDVNENEQDVD